MICPGVPSSFHISPPVAPPLPHQPCCISPAAPPNPHSPATRISSVVRPLLHPHRLCAPHARAQRSLLRVPRRLHLPPIMLGAHVLRQLCPPSPCWAPSAARPRCPCCKSPAGFAPPVSPCLAPSAACPQRPLHVPRQLPLTPLAALCCTSWRPLLHVLCQLCPSPPPLSWRRQLHVPGVPAARPAPLPPAGRPLLHVPSVPCCTSSAGFPPPNRAPAAACPWRPLLHVPAGFAPPHLAAHPQCNLLHVPAGFAPPPAGHPLLLHVPGIPCCMFPAGFARAPPSARRPLLHIPSVPCCTSPASFARLSPCWPPSAGLPWRPLARTPQASLPPSLGALCCTSQASLASSPAGRTLLHVPGIPCCTFPRPLPAECPLQHISSVACCTSSTGFDPGPPLLGALCCTSWALSAIHPLPALFPPRPPCCWAPFLSALYSHVNIQGDACHAAEFTAYIRLHRTSPAIVCSNETFLENSPSSVTLCGYELVTTSDQ